MTISPGSVRSVAPRYRMIPPRVSSAGAEAVELLESAGRPPDPWQADALDVGLSERADGRWAASEVGLIVPRQNGKGDVELGKALHSMYLSPVKLILWSAHEFKTAREMFLRTRDVIDGCHDLARRVKTVRTSHGEEGIELLDGTRLGFVARSRGSGRGFSPEELILDEAYALTDEQMSAMMPSISAQQNPQVWYGSSHPLAASVVLRRLCRRGRDGGRGLAYVEYSADPAAENDDPAAWADANPFFPHRLSADSIIREVGAMDPDDFRRERLGIVNLDGLLEQVIPPALWKRLADPLSKALDPVAFAIDTSPDRRATAIGAAGRRADGLLHVEVVEHRSGSGWVVARVLELVARHEPCAVVVDPASPAGAFIADLEKEGVEVLKLSARETAHAHGAFRNDAANNRLRHLNQPELNAALAGAAVRNLSDAQAWSRKDSSVDISPLVAVTAAAYGFAVNGPDPDYDLLASVI